VLDHLEIEHSLSRRWGGGEEGRDRRPPRR
jgi:hypothetical protein